MIKHNEQCNGGMHKRNKVAGMESYKQGTMKLVVYIHLMMQDISEVLLRGASILHNISDTIHACFS